MELFPSLDFAINFLLPMEYIFQAKIKPGAAKTTIYI
jgi:hypothetical protein